MSTGAPVPLAEVLEPEYVIEMVGAELVVANEDEDDDEDEPARQVRISDELPGYRLDNQYSLTASSP